MMHLSNHKQHENLMGRRIQLLAVLASVALVWLVVLPRVAQIDVVDRHIQQMERQGIEVDAMFYTELNWQPPAGAAFR